MFKVSSRRSATPVHLGFPAIFEADVHDPPLSRAPFATPHVQTVRLTNLRYFVSQLYDALFDGILHLDRLAEHTQFGDMLLWFLTRRKCLEWPLIS
jgi:hypothetical protein